MPAGYLRVLLRWFAHTKESQAKLLRRTKLSATTLPEAEDAIEVWQFLRFVANLRADAPDWGLEVESSAFASAHGSLGAAALSAPTLGDTLRVLQRFTYLRAPYFRFEAAEDAQTLELRVGEQVGLCLDDRRPLLDAVLLSFQALVECALGRVMTEGGFDVTVSSRTPQARKYRQAFHAQVHFGQACAAMRVPQDWLLFPCALADVRRHSHAITDLERLERIQHGAEYVVSRVRQLIAKHASARKNLTLSQAANQLGLSRRTLSRRLTEHDISFGELVADHQRRAAKELLLDPTLTIAEVGFRLGYSDPANFGRAFRRWFGTSPLAYRHEALARDSTRRL